MSKVLQLVANEQFDADECRQYLKNIWPLFQEQSVKEAVASLLGTAGHSNNAFTYNQLLVLSFAMLIKISADNFDDAWAILEKYLGKKES